jgi:hypothetical protein
VDAWRQAVDLANMMLCLALRTGPERVYRRALMQTGGKLSFRQALKLTD